jgi:protocatechuate 3,4-dioxygenase beta subunit
MPKIPGDYFSNGRAGSVFAAGRGNQTNGRAELAHLFLRTGSDGRYEFRTVRPGGYSFPLPNRTDYQALVPAHIHFIVSAEGFRTPAAAGIAARWFSVTTRE